jgi:F0F1-type ATP synthase gamma subunit
MSQVTITNTREMIASSQLDRAAVDDESLSDVYDILYSLLEHIQQLQWEIELLKINSKAQRV